jgi:hypothetical protein
MRRVSSSAAAASLIACAVLAVEPASAAATYPEQQGSRGVNTFLNYHNASGLGPRIDPGTWVQVSCKVHDGTIASVNPDDYWYRIASAPGTTGTTPRPTRS